MHHTSSRATAFARTAGKSAAILLVAAACSSCKKTPEGILPKEEMAQLMADIHLGEAMIDFNYSSYPNDSTRKMLKQSIYAAHNVSAEEVDTSYVWYGNHIEDYIKVYDRTIEIIQERQRNIANATHAQISVAGDSVQVWGGPQRLIVGSRMPSRIITFNLMPDSTWKKGDIYTLSYKLINSQSPVKSRLLIDYAEGLTGYADEPSTQKTTTTLSIQPDTMLTPVRIYGYITFAPERNKVFEVDSISLTRVRRELMPKAYHRQNKFDYTPNNSIEDNTPSVADFNPAPAEAPRHQTTQKKRPEATPSTTLPQPSLHTGRSSEHRMDASQHRPTEAQRRDVARQRNATTRPQKSQTLKKQHNPEPARRDR